MSLACIKWFHGVRNGHTFLASTSLFRSHRFICESVSGPSARVSLFDDDGLIGWDRGHVPFLILREVLPGSCQYTRHLLKQLPVCFLDLAAAIFNHLFLFRLDDRMVHGLRERVVNRRFDAPQWRLMLLPTRQSHSFNDVSIYLRYRSIHYFFKLNYIYSKI